MSWKTQEQLTECARQHLEVDEIIWYGDSRQREIFLAAGQDFGEYFSVQKLTQGMHLHHSNFTTGTFTGYLLYQRSAMNSNDLGDEEDRNWQVNIQRLRDLWSMDFDGCRPGRRGTILFSFPLWEVHVLVNPVAWKRGLHSLITYFQSRCPLHEIVYIPTPPGHDHGMAEACRHVKQCAYLWVQNSERLRQANEFGLQVAQSLGLRIIDTRGLFEAMPEVAKEFTTAALASPRTSAVQLSRLPGTSYATPINDHSTKISGLHTMPPLGHR
mmetsp:Transcript_65575/g.143133  ORF Transcript_65575/g.143133 Transcript_65575/m.143133 type:complete len:270 (-) Transcript_65575:113-922(-)